MCDSGSGVVINVFDSTHQTFRGFRLRARTEIGLGSFLRIFRYELMSGLLAEQSDKSPISSSELLDVPDQMYF